MLAGLPSMASAPSGEIDTVIIGNGPSALILSYILHGHVPYYKSGHGDALLDDKLKTYPNLLNVTPDIYGHLRSSINYSSQALPVNALLDTLLRPKGDTSLGTETCIEWRVEPEKSIKHVVLGNAPAPGGLWAENPVAASWDIGTLSYAEQLSLPGYTIEEHWLSAYSQKLPDLIRPTRREVAEYLAAYPMAVGIQNSIQTSSSVSHVSRTRSGFHVLPQNIRCKHLVLATGIFNINLPPPSFLSRNLIANSDDAPVLVIGSGFTAADIIISTPPTRKVIHIYNWDPIKRPSPLKACHPDAYPDYAWIYRHMSLAAERTTARLITASTEASKDAPDGVAPFVKQRDWATSYEGFSNARLLATSFDVDFEASSEKPSLFAGRRKSSAPGLGRAITVDIGRSSIGDSVRRTIGSFKYAVGRRGSLSYLASPLFQEIVPENPFIRPSVSVDGARVSEDLERPRWLDAHLAPPSGDVRRSSLSTEVRRASMNPTRPRSSTGASQFIDEEFPPQFLRSDTLTQLRRGSADFDFALEPKPSIMITGKTLREKIEAGQEMSQDDVQEHTSVRTQGFEVTPQVFAIGSLTGDSLIRFALGGCVVVAGRLMREAGILEPLPFDVTTSKLPAQPAQLDGHTRLVELPRSDYHTQNMEADPKTLVTPATAATSVPPKHIDAPPQRQSADPFANYSLNPSNESPIRQRLSTDIDPKHETHMHLQGQDHAAVEQTSAATSAGQGLPSAHRASISSVQRRDERKGSIFGRVKDKIMKG